MNFEKTWRDVEGLGDGGDGEKWCNYIIHERNSQKIKNEAKLKHSPDTLHPSNSLPFSTGKQGGW